MKKVMQAEIFDKSGKLYVNIELPATFEEMEDCLEKIHSTSERKKQIGYFLISTVKKWVKKCGNKKKAFIAAGAMWS